MISISQVQDQLHIACDVRDAARISQLFANHPLSADDATDALRDADMDFALVLVLLQHGADPNVVDIRMILNTDRQHELLGLLAEYNYAFGSDGHLILQDFAHDRATLDWLLEQGADVNRTDNGRLDNGSSLPIVEKENSLHLLNNVAADGNVDLFNHLVLRGADPSRSLALHAGSRCEDPDASKAMICHLLDQHDMDINRSNENFQDFFHDPEDAGSPLCCAVFHRNLAAVHELLKRDARVKDPICCPVYYAVKADGFLPAVEPLLRAGADPTEALISAVTCLSLDAAKICMDFDPELAPALQAAHEQEESRIKSIADDAAYHEKWPDLDGKDEYALEEERATEQKSQAMIELLRSATKLDHAVHNADTR